MIVPFVACLAGLVVVLIALGGDEPRRPPPRTQPTLPVMPTAADIVRVDFPMAWPGYDPAAVDLHLEALAKAWTELMAATPPEIVGRAERLAALRASIPPRNEEPEPSSSEAPRSTLGDSDPDAPDEALRTHAALELLSASRMRPS